VKAFALIKNIGQIDSLEYPYHGYVEIESFRKIGAWKPFIISGTKERLKKLNSLPNVIGLCVVTETGETRWPELDEPVAEALRSKLNNWLEEHGYPTIPEGWTNRRVVREVVGRFNDQYNIFTDYDVTDE